VAVHDHGQMTFEVQTVPDGDQRVKDRAQMAQIKTLSKDQMVHVKWVRAHDGHYYITELFAGPQDGAPYGLLTGTLITAGEDRVVVAQDAGGQVTLEAPWIRRRGQHERDPFYGLLAQDLKPGDKVIAMWQLGEGTHFITRGLAKRDSEGQALALVLLQAELRETYNQVNELENQISGLRSLIERLLEQIGGQQH